MDAKGQTSRPNPPHALGTQAVRMKKWRKWAREMRENGWTIEEPNAPDGARK